MDCAVTTKAAEAPSLPGPANDTAHEPSSLDHFLQPLRALLDDADVTEICINRPHEAFVERSSPAIRCAE